MKETLYQAVPHVLYPAGEEGYIHFNKGSLALTEVSRLHCEVLAEFHKQRTRNGALNAHGGDMKVVEVIDDLINLGVVSDEKYPDEPKLLQQLNLRPSKQSFRVVLTERCNLRCVGCFVTAQSPGIASKKVQKAMTEETLFRVMQETILYGAHEQITYHFFGGEPLIRFDLIKMAVAICESAVEGGKMVRPLYTITTNATLVSDEIISFFKEHDFKVGVSVDGPRGMHDRFRVLADGRGTFDTVKGNYGRLLNAGIDCHVLITPHHGHIDELPKIFRDVLKDFPTRTVTMNTPLHPETLQWAVSGEEYARAIIEVERIAREHGVEVDSAASPPLAALANGVRRGSPCSIVCDKVMASISTGGTKSFCSQKWDSRLAVSLTGAIEVPVRRASDCGACEALGICGGPCPAFQRITDKPFDRNKCNFMRALLKEVSANLDLFDEEPE